MKEILEVNIRNDCEKEKKIFTKLEINLPNYF